MPHDDQPAIGLSHGDEPDRAGSGGVVPEQLSNPFEIGPAQVPVSPPPIAALPPRQLPADFVETLYLALNPDVDDAVSAAGVDAGAAHWLRHGWAEDRPSLPHHAALTDGFAPEWLQPDAETARFDSLGYLHLNPDLGRALGNDLDAARGHWIRFGRVEGRIGPGAIPYARRRPSLEALLALPFGIEVHGAFADLGARGLQARRLVRDLIAAGIPTRARAFLPGTPLPRIALSERARRPGYRVSLIIAEPAELSLLCCLYPPDHFSASYVVAAWATEPGSFHHAWHPVFGAIDELWVGDRQAAAGYATSAPVPVQPLPLPRPERDDVGTAAPVPTVPEPAALVLLVSGDIDAVAHLVPAALDAVAEAIGNRSDVSLLLVPPPLPSMDDAYRAALTRAGLDQATVLAQPLTALLADALAQQGRLLVALGEGPELLLAADAFLGLGRPVLSVEGTPLARRLAGAIQVVPAAAQADHSSLLQQPQPRPDPNALVAALRNLLGGGGPDVVAAPPERPAAPTMRHRLEALGLTMRPPPFLAGLGRTGSLRVPPAMEALAPDDRAVFTGMASPPRFGLLLLIGQVEAGALQRCVAHVEAQLYPFWTLVVIVDRPPTGEVRRLLETLRGSDPRLRIEAAPHDLDAATQLNRIAALTDGTHLMLLQPQDRLLPRALLSLAVAQSAAPAAALLYADTIEDAAGVGSPGPDQEVRRSDFSLQKLRAEAFIGQLLVISRNAWQGCGGLASGFGNAALYDLALRVAEAGYNLVHVPQIVARSWPSRDHAAELRAVTAHALRVGGRVEPAAEPGRFRFRPAQVAGPATIVLVDPGRQGRAGMIELVRSLRREHRAAEAEIVLLHGANGPGQREIAALQAHSVRLEAAPRLNAGRAVLRALGLARASHPLVLFLDPGVTPRPGLLTALLEAACDPQVGAAGIRLTPSSQRDDRPDELRNVAAVSGACLLVRREATRIVRGYVEALTLDTACDVDLCFRIRTAGFRVVCTPYGETDPMPAPLPIEDASVQAQLSPLWAKPSQGVADAADVPARRVVPATAAAPAIKPIGLDWH